MVPPPQATGARYPTASASAPFLSSFRDAPAQGNSGGRGSGGGGGKKEEEYEKEDSAGSDVDA